MDNGISLDSYKIFCAVVKTGNMSAAAKELYISQPAVSMAVKQLEERLGSPLLIRTSKGVRLTPEGEVLYTYLDRALNMINTAEHKYLEMANLEQGEVRIGASDIVISGYLMPYIEKYSNIYSDIRIKVINKTTYESLRLLKSGTIDMCFVNLPIENTDDLEITKCLEIHDCLIGGTKYKELAKSGIELSKLSNYSLLLLEDMSNTRRQLDKFAAENGIVFKPIIELASYDLLIQFAKINLGLTFIIREFDNRAIDGESIFEIPVKPQLPNRYVGLVKLKNVALSYAANKFVEMLDLKES
ncbi:MAG: LysR family transcriptional regulator [Candidatus Metalachnospira sp.]|nr:LysR family transcriptional regulator [Candidatus Metalachnospira sp.]